MAALRRALARGPGRAAVLLTLATTGLAMGAALGPGALPLAGAHAPPAGAHAHEDPEGHGHAHAHGGVHVHAGSRADEADTPPGPSATAPYTPAPDSVAARLSPRLVVEAEARQVTLEAVARPGGFEASLPPDHQYHALVYHGGSAAGKALFLTAVPDTTVARALRELGADDGGGVPMAAWNLRWVPLVPQPASRVQGTPLEVSVSWNSDAGEVTLPLGELLQDPGGRGTSFRFGGNEDQNHHWDSGCIVCLFSCPGGVISNEAYTIRDHQRGVTRFLPGDRMPPEGTVVRITFTLSQDAQGP